MLVGDGGPNLLSTDGNKWTIKFSGDDPSSGSNDANTVETVHNLVSPTHPENVAKAGQQYKSAGETLIDHADRLQGHSDTLATVWSGEVAQKRQQWISQLGQTATELGGKSLNIGQALAYYAPKLASAKQEIEVLYAQKKQLAAQLNGVRSQLSGWDNVLTQIAGGLLPPLGAVDAWQVANLRSQAADLQGRMHGLDAAARKLLADLTQEASDAFTQLPAEVTKNLPSK